MSPYVPPPMPPDAVRLTTPQDIEAAVDASIHRQPGEDPDFYNGMRDAFISLARDGSVTYWRTPDGKYHIRAEIDPNTFA